MVEQKVVALLMSIRFRPTTQMPEWRNGIRTRLKILRSVKVIRVRVPFWAHWENDRVVECTGLENRQSLNRFVGSNPTSPAKILKQNGRILRKKCTDWHCLGIYHNDCFNICGVEHLPDCSDWDLGAYNIHYIFSRCIF